MVGDSERKEYPHELYAARIRRSYRALGHLPRTGQFPQMKTGEFYIQDMRSYVGNSVMWWCVDGQGYTTDLTKAWRVPGTWRGRDTDKLWPCDEIDARATRQFDMQRFREIKSR